MSGPTFRLRCSARLAVLAHRARWAITLLVLSVVAVAPSARGQSGGYSLRLYGHGINDIDRVKVAIDAPPRPADVAFDFTLEWWMKASAADNTSGSCTEGDVAWINGNIIFDRDVYGDGDYGDWGVSLYGGRIAFGVDREGAAKNSICTAASVADGAWHHIAVTRDASAGVLRIFVDGQLHREDSGPTGDVSYRDGLVSPLAPDDPFLVLGAEKHDAGPNYPSYSGWLDEVRLSTVVRYTANFTPPAAPFVTDGATVLLYHFDQGPAGPCTGTVVDDSGAPGGPSNGTCLYGGSAPAGPVYSTDTPVGSASPPTPTRTSSPSPSRTRTPTPSRTRTLTPTRTRTATPTITRTPTLRPTRTFTPSPTTSPTPISSTPTPTVTTILTTTPTRTLSGTAPPTLTPTGTATATPSVASSPSSTVAAVPTHTPTRRVTGTASATSSPTRALTLSPTSTATPTASVTPQAIRGDVNGDGSIGNDDVTSLLVALFLPDPPSAADLNGDSRVTSADVTSLVQILPAAPAP